MRMQRDLDTEKSETHWLGSAQLSPSQEDLTWSQSSRLRATLPPTLPGSSSLFFCPFPLRHSAPLTRPHGFAVHLHSTGSECSKAGFCLLCTLESWHTLGTHDLLVKWTNKGTTQNWKPGMNRQVHINCFISCGGNWKPGDFQTQQ